MNAPVDVLAVLKKEADYSGCLGPRAAEARTKRLMQVHAAVAELIELACMVDRSDNAARWGDACRPIVTKARECLALVGGAS